ncbi:GLPGLI family protein [Zunongwangia endophytica]|uniref:GLPGLI family protein n=1 Tax=Zunongwangia endophytica TaxID=1808945 RepID=A0ABV8H9A5_9FLAO|nr:GLPGLI family protein [Zunongwangia endophytica]MDN3594688.1 GLPGLI family protein [Zunongwangia endophytica]
MAKFRFILFLFFSINMFSQNVEVIYKASAKHIDTIENVRSSNIIRKITNNINDIMPNIDFVLTSNNNFYNMTYKRIMPNDLQNENFFNLSIIRALDGVLINGDFEKGMSYYESRNLKKVRSVNMDNIEWTITKEYKNIIGYKCYKAIGSIKDPDQENKLTPPSVAWFAPEMNFRGGPTAYANLPGLILELETPKIIFKATDLKMKRNVSLKEPKYNSDNILPHKEWQIYFEKMNPIPKSNN